MELEIEAKKLVNYIKRLGLEIPTRKPSHKHVGAIIADAVLQGGGRRYKTQVEPRVERIRDKYPAADTISGLSSLLKTEGAQALLNWSGKDEQERFCQTVYFFENEQINTFDNLRKWLESEDNRDRLVTKSNRVDKAGISKIADATADYYRVLVRLPDAVKVDSRVKKFLRDAGVTLGKYEESRAIVQLAARQLGKRPIDLEGAIWNYREKENKEVEKMNGGNEEEKTGKDTDRLPLKKAHDFALKKGYDKESEYVDSLLNITDSFTLKRALYMRLFEKKECWSEFKNVHWTKGDDERGQKRVRDYHNLSQKFVKYLEDVAKGRRPYDELGILE